jgi:hypothetical protein
LSERRASTASPCPRGAPRSRGNGSYALPTLAATAGSLRESEKLSLRGSEKLSLRGSEKLSLRGSEKLSLRARGQ